jgi:uncharacterized damage-inducible protein DinB
MTLQERGLELGKVKAFGSSSSSFMGYLIEHEFYHLGGIGILLGESEHKLSKEVQVGLWEWR